jgi:hypothetical protein
MKIAPYLAGAIALMHIFYACQTDHGTQTQNVVRQSLTEVLWAYIDLDSYGASAGPLIERIREAGFDGLMVNATNAAGQALFASDQLPQANGSNALEVLFSLEGLGKGIMVDLSVGEGQVVSLLTEILQKYPAPDWIEFTNGVLSREASDEIAGLLTSRAPELGVESVLTTGRSAVCRHFHSPKAMLVAVGIQKGTFGRGVWPILSAP